MTSLASRLLMFARQYITCLLMIKTFLLEDNSLRRKPQVFLVARYAFLRGHQRMISVLRINRRLDLSMTVKTLRTTDLLSHFMTLCTVLCSLQLPVYTGQFSRGELRLQTATSHDKCQCNKSTQSIRHIWGAGLTLQVTLPATA
jgi:hypothetical protein